MNQELGQARAKHTEWQGKNTASTIDILHNQSLPVKFILLNFDKNDEFISASLYPRYPEYLFDGGNPLEDLPRTVMKKGRHPPLDRVPAD